MRASTSLRPSAFIVPLAALAALIVIVAAGLMVARQTAEAGVATEIIEVDPNTLSCTGVVTFQDPAFPSPA